MVKYNRVSIFEPDCFNPQSPVEILKGGLLTDNSTSEIIAQFKLHNQSQKRIIAVTILVDCHDSSNKWLTAFEYTYKRSIISAGEVWGDSIAIPISNKSTLIVKAIIIGVTFESGDTVSFDKSNYCHTFDIDYTEIKNQSVFKFAQEKLFPQNDQILRYYPKESEKCWVCTCGKVNTKQSPICARCLLEKQAQFLLINDEYVVSLENAVNAQCVKQKKTLAAILISVAGVVAICLLAYFFYFVPLKDYQAAKELLQQENYDDAIIAFEEIGAFKDSQQQKNNAIELRHTKLIQELQNDLDIVIQEIKKNEMTCAEELTQAKITSLLNILPRLQEIIRSADGIPEILTIAKQYESYVQAFADLGGYSGYAAAIEIMNKYIDPVQERFVQLLSDTDFRTLSVSNLNDHKRYFANIKNEIPPHGKFCSEISLSLSKMIDGIPLIIDGARANDKRYTRGLDLNVTGFEDFVTVFERVKQIEVEIDASAAIPKPIK